MFFSPMVLKQLGTAKQKQANKITMNSEKPNLNFTPYSKI